MLEFKIIVPAGYNVQNIFNDNIDLNIILPDGTVFFTTFFTLKNIQTLIEDELYFWSTDMVIVKDLKKETIKKAVTQIIKDGYVELSFSKIGTIETIYFKKKYEEIEDSF